jgi:hypothetical protein
MNIKVPKIEHQGPKNGIHTDHRWQILLFSVTYTT